MPKPNQNTRARGRWLEVKGGREGEKKRRDIEASNRGDGWMEGRREGGTGRSTDRRPSSPLISVGGGRAVGVGRPPRRRVGSGGLAKGAIGAAFGCLAGVTDCEPNAHWEQKTIYRSK